MSAKTHETVTITLDKGKLKCDPDWVHLNWQTGPKDIRWVFGTMPSNAAGAAVEFLTSVPAKYPPPTTGTFRPGGVHKGTSHAPASGGSHVHDIVTSGNTNKGGYFYYEVRLLDAAGSVLAVTDPGGDNQPDPPSHS